MATDRLAARVVDRRHTGDLPLRENSESNQNSRTGVLVDTHLSRQE